MSVRLFIRDNSSGSVHEYGHNQHDSLLVNPDGSLHYYNLQNGCGTMDEYTFVLEDGTDPRTKEDYIEFGCEGVLDIGGDYYESGKGEEDRKLWQELFPNCEILG